MDGLLPTDEAMARIKRLRQLRWVKGREARGLAEDAPFHGQHPHAEMMEEVIDALNYLEVARGRMPLWAERTLEHLFTQAALILLEFGE